MISKGFTLIEVVIVFSIVALVMALAIPGFSEFNRTQVLKTASEDFRSSFREAQSASLAGKKERCDTSLFLPAEEPTCSEVNYCDDTHTLIGYYITVSNGMLKYSIGIRCGIDNIVDYPVKNLSFSNSDLVSVEKMILHYSDHTDETKNEITVLFRPVNLGVSFIENGSNGQTELNPDSLEIILTNLKGRYSVFITSTGNLYEYKL